jgi:hypothetical protein
VTVIQRASIHLAQNPHFHSIVTDGVYVRDPATGALVFRALPEPSRTEVLDVAWQTCQRVLLLLRKRGLWLDADPREDTPWPVGSPGSRHARRPRSRACSCSASAPASA